MLFFHSFPNEQKMYFQSCYTFFEYLVFATIFWVNFPQKNFRRLILVLSTAFLIFQLIYVLTVDVRAIDSVPIGIETIIILIYIFFYFFQSSKNLGAGYIYNHYGFWICVGILIYLGGSFFFFILFDHLTNEQVKSFGDLTYLAEIIKNVLFSVAIFVHAHHASDNKKEHTKSIPFLDLDIT